MTSEALAHRAMIAAVARALGPDLLARMAFLGGCATGLLITDEVTRESVRYTDDVDLIVAAVTYALALETAEWYPLTPDLSIRLVTPSLLTATKLEAYRGRGKGNLLESRDIEDLINLFNGRDDIVEQIAAADDEVRCYIADVIAGLLKKSDFEYAIQGNLHDPEREPVIFERLEAVAVMRR